MEREQTGLAQGLDARLLRHRSRPESEDAVQLANDLVHASRAAEALEVTAAALRSAPEDGKLLLAQAHAWLQEGQLENAQASLIRAARVSPNSKECFRLLGEVLLKRGDPVRALRVIERARALDPHDRAVQLLYDRCARFARIAETAGAGDLIPSSIIPPGREPSKDERTVVRPELSERLAREAVSEHAPKLQVLADEEASEEPTSFASKSDPISTTPPKEGAAPRSDRVHELTRRVAIPSEAPPSTDQEDKDADMRERDDIPPEYVAIGALRSPAPPKDLVAAKEHTSDDNEPDPFPERARDERGPRSKATARQGGARSAETEKSSGKTWVIALFVLLALGAAAYFGWATWFSETPGTDTSETPTVTAPEPSVSGPSPSEEAPQEAPPEPQIAVPNPPAEEPERSPDSPAARWTSQADALLAQDRVDDAARAYDEALRIDDVFPEALLGRARVALRAERFAQAIRHLDKLSDTLTRREVSAKFRGEFLLARSRAWLGAGQSDKAREALNEAKTIDGIAPEVWFLLGEANAGADTPAARQAYETYLQQAPQGEFAARARRALAPR